MSREIKFRAWDKDSKTMLINPNAGLVYGETINSCFNDDDRIFMQFTGLLDRNGVEIYEGDIIQFNDGTCRAVAHDAEHTGFKLDGEDPVNPLWQMHGSIEVIGNIYENKELLNV